MSHNFEFSVAYEIGSTAAASITLESQRKLATPVSRSFIGYINLQISRRIRCAGGSTEQLLPLFLRVERCRLMDVRGVHVQETEDSWNHRTQGHRTESNVRNHRICDRSISLRCGGIWVTGQLTSRKRLSSAINQRALRES
jgi:hypothetical protein